MRIGPPREDDEGKDPPQDSSVAERNAVNWRTSGYERYKAGDAQREKDLPIGGIAPHRPDPNVNLKPQKPMKPLKSFGSRIGAKKP